MGNRTVIMYWDCDQCGTKDISGLERNCPHCGRPRSTETDFHFIKGKEKEYLDEETADKIGKEPDWLCSFCNSLNNAKNDTCTSCGASKEESEKNYFQMKKEREEKFREKQEQEIYERYKETESNEIPVVSKVKSFFKTDYIKSYLIAFAATFVLILLGLFAFLPKTKEVHVDSHTWEYNIDVEEYKTFSESDWTLPPGARLKNSQVEFKEFVPVLDHYETRTVTEQVYEVVGSHTEYSYVDNGNGTATEVAHSVPDYGYVTHTRQEDVPIYRDEPVYATKYYYDIDRWTYTRSVTTSNNNTEPYWGELVLGDKERESGRNEKYTINTTSKKGKQISYDIPYELWIKAKDNTDVKITVKLGKVTKLEN